ncbi:MAG TPA: SDR family oxidoreductase [Longimicrobiales bacterium]|nr:SDR family oxidoreductase [Longimicrobiales bacterium]
MSAALARRSTFAALAVGLTLGAVASCGTALLLYTGQGFLRAAGLLVSSTMMALAAGLWAGAPEPASRTHRTARGRWMALLAALIAGGLFAAFWSGRAQLRELAWGGALAVLLELALPAYAAGTLLAALHSRDRRAGGPGSAIAAAAIAGSAVGILLAATTLIPNLDPYVNYYGGAALLALVSIYDRSSTAASLDNGATHMTDRVVIVTGAADPDQLGHIIARRFLDAGARVVISARSESVSDAAASLASAGDVLAVRADLTSDEDVARLVVATRERFGRLDALVNVAGGLSVIATVENTTPEEWQREIERNAGTALRLSRAALPLLRESRGAIVNFTSPAAERAPARLAAYSAAKAAVSALTRSLAIEETATGVRVNAIAPGIMDTAQNRSEMGEGAKYVRRADVASVAVFLAGAGAAGITGETVHVLGDTIR